MAHSPSYHPTPAVGAEPHTAAIAFDPGHQPDDILFVKGPVCAPPVVSPENKLPALAPDDAMHQKTIATWQAHGHHVTSSHGGFFVSLHVDHITRPDEWPHTTSVNCKARFYTMTHGLLEEWAQCCHDSSRPAMLSSLLQERLANSATTSSPGLKRSS